MSKIISELKHSYDLKAPATVCVERLSIKDIELFAILDNATQITIEAIWLEQVKETIIKQNEIDKLYI